MKDFTGLNISETVKFVGIITSVKGHALSFSIFCREVARAIVESIHWKKALSNTTYYSNGKFTTPLRQLIRGMPGQCRGCAGSNCGTRRSTNDSLIITK